MNIKIARLHAEAKLPKRASSGAACFDLHALIEDDIHGEKPLVLHPGQQTIIRTGLAFEIPPGTALMIYSRSGHGFKNGVRLSNAVGVLDADYRGEAQVALHNDGKAKFTLRHGDRIAQAMILELPNVAITEVTPEELSATARGAGGFGSTGK